jgi:hypothetical protein
MKLLLLELKGGTRYVVIPLLGNGNGVLGFDVSAYWKTCLGRNMILQLHYRYPSPFSFAFLDSWNFASKFGFQGLQERSDHGYVDAVALVFDSGFVASIHVEVGQIEVGEEVLLPPWSSSAEGGES